MKSLVYKLGTQTAVTAVALLLVFAPFTSLMAQAQTLPAGCTTTTVGGITTYACGPSQAITPATTAPTSTTPPASPPQTDIFAGCKQFTVSTCVTSILYAFTVGIGSTFAYIAVYFFDVTVQLSLNGSAYGLDFISTSWTTARDLANMAFLFILLFIAFQIIFRADTSGTMQLLASVIIVALLVNFSFFFTRVIIDAGNIVSVQFYNAIPVQSLASSINGSNLTPTVGTTLGNAANSVTSYLGAGTTKDLTAGIMNMLQIQNLLNSNSLTAVNGVNGGTPGGSTIATLFLFIAIAIIFWLLTVTFVTAAVKFLFRVVVLWFLIIVSPLAFIAAAVQGMDKGYFKTWREMLVAEAFYPVAFLFILLILNNFAVTLSGTNGTQGLIASVFTSLPGGASGANLSSWPAIGAALVSVVIRLGLVVGVLYVAMQASNKIGTVGAQYAEKAGSWVGGAYKNTFSWAGGAAYRNIGGRAANAIDNSVKNSRWANTPGTFGGLVGYRLRKNVLAPAKATSLGTVASSWDERQKFLKDRKADMNNNLRDTDNKKKIADASVTIKDNIAANKPAGDGVPKDDKDRIQSLSKRELEVMTADEIKAIAPLLKESQIKLLEGIEKLNDTQREGIKTEWQVESSRNIERKVGGVKASIAAGAPVSDADKKKAQTITKQEMEKMSTAELKQLAAVMSEDQKKKVDELDIPDADKESIKNEWEEKGYESPYQKSVKRLREVSLGNREVARELSTLGPADIIDTKFAQKIKTITDRENSLAKELHKKASKEYINKQTALDAAHAAHAAAPTAATLAAKAAAQTAHDTAELAEGAAHAELQKTQALTTKYKEFEENLRKIEANKNINNGTKGVFKAHLI